MSAHPIKESIAYEVCKKTLSRKEVQLKEEHDALRANN
jgi:hypothetical protein